VPAIGVALAAALALPANAQDVDRAIEATTETVTQSASRFGTLVSSDPWFWGHVIGAIVVVVSLVFADVIRPGSLERAGKRSLDPHSPILLLLCGATVIGAMMVGGAFVSLLKPEWRGVHETTQATAVVMGLQYAFAIVIAVLLARLVATSAKSSGLAFTARSLPWGLVGGVLAWPAVIAASLGFVAVHRHLGYAQPDVLGHDTLRQISENRNDPWAWGLAFMAIVAAPIVEEIVYRGFLQSALLKMFGSPWVAIILTSTAFGAVHMVGAQSVQWYSAATVGVLGLCCGIAFEHRKEIGVPIMMHVLFNLTNVVLALLIPRS